MRLTHSVTIGEDDYANVYAEVNTEPDDTHPILVKYSQDDGAVICLSFEQFDVIAALVRAHRPDNVTDTPIVDDVCGATLAEDPENPCVLMPDHLPVYGGAWTHIDRQGRKFNDTPPAHG